MGGSGAKIGRMIFFSSCMFQRPFYTSRFAVLSQATSVALDCCIRQHAFVGRVVGGSGGRIGRVIFFSFNSYMLQHPV